MPAIERRLVLLAVRATPSLRGATTSLGAKSPRFSLSSRARALSLSLSCEKREETGKSARGARAPRARGPRPRAGKRRVVEARGARALAVCLG